jgi:hypothetical protein
MASASLPKGVDLPDTRHVNGVKLQRNGHGIRSISFFGYDVKVYVAGFYTEVALTSEADVLQCRDSPMQLDFTFLRSVNKGRVISAWQQQLEHSVSYKYDGYEKDRDSFIEKLSSPIAFGGTQTVQLIGDNTVIVDQGSQKGNKHFLAWGLENVLDFGFVELYPRKFSFPEAEVLFSVHKVTDEEEDGESHHLEIDWLGYDSAQITKQ